MATAAHIPVTVADDAEERIQALGMGSELETMLQHTRRAVPGLQAIEVRPHFDPEVSGDPLLVITAYKERPAAADDPTRRLWDAWVVRAFPPDVYRWFIFDVDYRDDHAR